MQQKIYYIQIEKSLQVLTIKQFGNNLLIATSDSFSVTSLHCPGFTQQERAPQRRIY